MRHSILCAIVLCGSMVYSNDLQVDSLAALLAQHPARDSARIEILIQLCEKLYRTNPELVIGYAEEATKLSESLLRHDTEMEGAYYLAQAYWFNGNYDQGLMAALKSMALSELRQDELMIGKNKATLAMIATNIGNYSEAFSYYYEALPLFENSKDSLQIAKCLNNIGFTTMKLGEYQKAISYLERSITYNEKLGIESSLAINNNNIGICYKELRDFQKAFSHLSRALEISKQINFQSEIGVVLRSFAETHFELGEYDKALAYVRQSISLERKLASKLELSRSLNVAANIFLATNRYDDAISFASEANTYTSEAGFQFEQMESLEILYKTFIKRGDFRNALDYQSQYMVTKDSIFSLNTARQIISLQFQQDIERQKAQNSVLEKEKELAQAIMSRQNAQRLILISIAVLLGTIVVIVFISLRNSRRANRRIEQQREDLATTAEALQASNNALSKLYKFKEGLTYMIAHDMKNSLNTILGLSEKDLENERMYHISRAGYMMLNMVTNMLDVQRFEEAKVKLNYSVAELHQLVDEAKTQVILLMQMKSLRLETSIDRSLKVKVDKEIFVRVLVNLLTNSIKYSPVGKTVWLEVMVGSSLMLIVRDEGKGISQDKLPHIFDKFWNDDSQQSGKAASTGLGLAFCKLAIEEHGGRIEVDSVVGVGTTMRIVMPIDLVVYDFSVSTPLVRESAGDGNGLIMVGEHEALSKLADELRGMQVYQVGQLDALFKRFNLSQFKSRWTLDLQAAVHHGDEEKYNELLSLFT